MKSKAFLRRRADQGDHARHGSPHPDGHLTSWAAQDDGGDRQTRADRGGINVQGADNNSTGKRSSSHRTPPWLAAGSIKASISATC